MFQIEECKELAKYCKEVGLNVWCFTGFTFEQLQKMKKTNSHLEEFMENIDILVDGKFEEDKKSLNLYFRGSSNQRIIEMKESLRKNKAIEVEKYKIKQKSIYDMFGKTEYMFI